MKIEKIDEFMDQQFFRKLKSTFDTQFHGDVYSIKRLRPVRSTNEVPLVDETSNTPTEFADKLVGSDDLDTFTALAAMTKLRLWWQ